MGSKNLIIFISIIIFITRWQLPHFSTQVATSLTMARSPYTVYLGPSREALMSAVMEVTRVVMRTNQRPVSRPIRGQQSVALVTHHTGILDMSSLVSQLQEENLAVQVKRKLIFIV